MSDLDRILTRIRALPDEQQAQAAHLLEDFLEERASGSLLTDAQWAEVKARLSKPGEMVEHDAVVTELREKFGA